MAKSHPKGQKTLWEKEKLLAMSNFSFSQCFQKTCAADMCDSDMKQEGHLPWSAHLRLMFCVQNTSKVGFD